MAKIIFSKYPNMKIGDILCKELKINGFFYSDDHICVCYSEKCEISNKYLIGILDSLQEKNLVLRGICSNIGNCMAEAIEPLKELKSGIDSLDKKYWNTLNSYLV